MSDPTSKKQVLPNAGDVSPIKVYSKDECIFCERAKKLLQEINLDYEEIKLDPNGYEKYKKERNRLIEQTDHKTFPWIFIGEKFIGGFTDLKHAHNTLKLNDYVKEYTNIQLDIDF